MSFFWYILRKIHGEYQWNMRGIKTGARERLAFYACFLLADFEYLLYTLNCKQIFLNSLIFIELRIQYCELSFWYVFI